MSTACPAAAHYRPACAAGGGALAEVGDGTGLPQVVEREFREFLRCGVFEGGVARFQCEGCARRYLLPL